MHIISYFIHFILQNHILDFDQAWGIGFSHVELVSPYNKERQHVKLSSANN